MHCIRPPARAHQRVPSASTPTPQQRNSIFIPESRDPSDEFNHATGEIAIGNKLGIDVTKKLPGEGFKRPWPPLIKMDAAVKAKAEKQLNGGK